MMKRLITVKFRLRRQHFTVAQRICTTAQCFHIYFSPGLDNEQSEASVRRPAGLARIIFLTSLKLINKDQLFTVISIHI
ncbi:hypothetical protein C9Z70_25330 (plasmid) [Escherichia coli]|nr:hypothetical protein AW074_20625 [Escherichia coli]TJP94155.1 hypothetical protein C9Z70_25330 [Escherichia coli]